MRGLIALLAIIATATAVDEFTFDVTFTCNYNQRENFQYNVQFFDHDSWISGDDAITKQRIGKGTPGVAKFTMFGYQEGDEISSNGYEVYMRLYHNCNEYQKEAEVYLYISPVCLVGKGRCHYTISKDIKELTGSENLIADLKYE